VQYRVYPGGGGPSQGIPEDFSQFFTRGGPQGQPRTRAPQKKKRPEKIERKVRASDGTVLVQRGHDVHSEVRLSVEEAILGTTSKVATLDGTAKVRIPPGTPSGVKLRLKDKGVNAPGGKKGCHYVTVQIDVPKDLSDTSKNHLADFVASLKKR